MQEMVGFPVGARRWAGDGPAECADPLLRLYKLLYAFLKLGLMLKGLYRFKPQDLAPKRALLGAIFTDFENFGHGGGLRSRADPVVPSPGSVSGRYVRSR